MRATKSLARRFRILLAPLLVAAVASVSAAGPAPLPTVEIPAASHQPPAHGHRFLFHVTLHTAAEIESLLARAEKLSRHIDVRNSSSGIALVLHGPEIRIFAKKNYAQYRYIVDRAKRLSKHHIIDIKLCRTKMKELHLREQDVPSWVEIVPYGPDEEKRLRGLGYIDL